MPPEDFNLFILAIDSGENLIFEIWVDKSKLIGNLSLHSAIATFIHVAFIFNLKYPKVNRRYHDNM